MTTSWIINIVAQAVVLAVFPWRKGNRMLWFNQAFSVTACMVLVDLYVWARCSVVAYENTKLVIDIACAVQEYVIGTLLLLKSKSVIQFLCSLIVLAHLISVVQWHLATIIGTIPTGSDVLLDVARTYLNYAVMAAYLLLAYSKDDATASEEANARTEAPARETAG